MQHSAFCLKAGFTVSCHVARAVALGLWKYDSGRHFQIPVGSSARLICRARKYDHVSPLLQELHWLSVPERINTDWPYWCFVAGMTWLQSTWEETFNGPPIQNLDSISVRHPVSN